MGKRPSDVARKRLLVLGAGPAQAGLLRAARARGLFVLACDRDPRALAFRWADRRALVSAEDEEGIERLARAERVDGLVAPGIDWPVAIAARVAARLGLPHPLAPATATASVSKLRQREVFSAHGVPQPRWTLVTDVDASVELPCVVKPPDRQGQRGLTFVRDPAELPAALAAALGASRAGEALVEELVEGPEVTVNAFSVDGRFHALTVTDRLTAEPPAFGVALAHVWPSEHETDAVVEAARRAAEALGVRDGPTYTQVRLTPDGPKVMELAARLGGGQDADLCRAALGVDLNALAIAAALGELVDVAGPAASGHVPVPGTETCPAPPKGRSDTRRGDAASSDVGRSGHVPVPGTRTCPAGGAAVRFLVAPPGELARVEGLEDALAVDGVLDALVYRAPGFRFGQLLRGADRAGFVLARGESRADALARADRAAGRIRFHVDAAALV